MKLGKIKEKLIFCIIFFVDFWKKTSYIEHAREEI